MSRAARGHLPAGEYHIYTRTPGRIPFFLDDTDRTDFCRRLRTVVARLDWRCLAFALLTNHYHLLVDVRENTPQIGMKWLNGTYAQQFNRRHDRWGHLWGARYSLVAVSSERQRIAVFRYIALNPVRAGLCRRPQDWPWSSYAGTAGHAEAFTFVDDTPIRDYFGHDESGRELLRVFVEEAVSEPLPGTVPG